jgi:hypothetical protein
MPLMALKPCLQHFPLGRMMSITESSSSQSITSRTRVPQFPHIPTQIVACGDGLMLFNIIRVRRSMF